MVKDGVTGSFLSGHLQTVWLNEPFMASLIVTTHHAIIIVDIRAWLQDLGQFDKPVQPV